MKKVILAVAAVLVLLLVAVVAVPRFKDWNGYKPQIAEAVKAATGRDLVIGGDIEVAVLPGIGFALSDVRLANAAGAAEAQMLSLETVRGKLALFPLILRNVVVEELVVTRPALHLEVAEDGRPNWAFEGAAPAAAAPAPAPDAEAGLPISDLTLGDVRLVDGLVTYRDARTGQVVEAKAINLKAALAGFASRFTLDGALILNDEPVALKLALDTPGGLLEGRRAALSTALETARLTLAYDGGLQRAPVPALDGTFDLAIPSVGQLAAWLQRPLAAGQPDPGPLKLHAVLKGEGAKMTLEEATLEGTALQARVSGGFDASGAVKQVTLELEAGVLDLDRYLPPRAEVPMAEHQARMAERHDAMMAARQGPRDPLAALPDAPFDLAPLRQTDARIKIAIGGIKAMGFEVGKIGFDAELTGGVLAASLAELRLYGGNVTGGLRLDGAGAALGVEADLAIDKVNVGALARAAQGDRAKVAGIATGLVQAKGSGESPRALAQSLQASATLALGGVDVKDTPGVVSALDLALELPGLDASPSLKGNVVYNKESVAFSLGLDPLQKVLSEERFAAKVGIDSKRVKLSYDGAVQSAPVAGLDGRFGLEVPSVGGLLAWLGTPLPKGQPDPGPLKINAVLAADGPTAALKEATIEGKGLNAKASGSFDGSGEIAKIALTLEAGVLDIGSYLPPPAKDAAAAPAAMPAHGGPSAPGAPGESPLAALPETPFDLAPLRQTEAAISLALGGVKVLGYEVGKTALGIDLKGGVLEIALRELRLYGGNVTATAKLDGAGDTLGVELAAAIDKVDVGALARAAQGDAAKVAGIASGSLTAAGQGKHPRALVEALAAKADLNLGGIDLKDAGAGALSEASVRLDMPGLDRPTSLKAGAVYNKERVSLDLALAPPKEVLSGKAFDLTATVASGLLNARYGGKVQNQPTPGLDGTFDLDVPSVGNLAAWLGQPLDPARPDPGPLKVKAVLSADGPTAALKEATIDGKAIKAKAFASFDASQPVKRFDANLEIIEADLNAYLPPRKEAQETQPAEVAAPAEAKGWSEEPFDLTALRQAEGQATIKIGRVRYGELDIENGTLSVSLAGGVLKTTLEKLRLAGGGVDVAATVDGSQAAAAVDYQVKVAGVQARPALKTFAGSDRLSGTMDFETAGRTEGLSQKQMVEALNGQGAFSFKDGAIHGVNLAGTLRNAGALGFGDSQTQQTDFAELSGSFAITKGVLDNRDLKMLAPLVRLAGAGVVRMPPRTVDYKLEAKLVASLEGQGGQDALAGLPIPIGITGSWDKPAYGVDWKSVLTNAALDPQRLANMPGQFRDLGKNLGVALPIPGAEGGIGGAAGGLLKAIPGLSGGQQPAPAEGEAPAPAAGIGGALQQILQPKAEAPAKTPEAPAEAQPAPAQAQPAPQQPAVPQALEGLKKLFGN